MSRDGGGPMKMSGAPESGQVTAPVVSVIIPVYNVAAYLHQCADSVLRQSLGVQRLELIAVDDGSTDASGGILDQYAATQTQVRVLRETNSGGPGRPRNVGLEHARGTYVFFLDADDYLGDEALERLVAMAERNAADIVLGRMVGIEGRVLPKSVFRRTVERADLPEVYSSLNVLKLFRRSLIERLGVRFTEAVKGGEDAPFAAALMLAASTISVVADYPCYYCRSRPGSQTRSPSSEHPTLRLLRMAQRAEYLAQHVPPGRRRDVLMARHIRDLLRPFGRRWLALDEIERRQMFEVGTSFIRRWSSPRIINSLSSRWAVPAYCLQRGWQSALEDVVGRPQSRVYQQPVVVGRRVFANYPHFRDHYKIPDRHFEITRLMKVRQQIDRLALHGSTLCIVGTAHLPGVGGSTTVILRRWPWGRVMRFPTELRLTAPVSDRYGRYPSAGFQVAIDLSEPSTRAMLGPGLWDARIEVGGAALRRQAGLSAPRHTLTRLAKRRPNRRARTALTLYETAAHTARLDVPGASFARSALEGALGRAEWWRLAAARSARLHAPSRFRR